MGFGKLGQGLEALVGTLVLAPLLLGLAVAVVVIYLLARAHTMGFIRFSIAGVELWSVRIVSLAMVLITFVASTRILTSLSALLFGDSFTYGSGHKIDETEVLLRWIVLGALASVIYIFMLIRSRQLADQGPARFIRNAYGMVATLFFGLASIVASFGLAQAIVDRVVGDKGIFDRSAAIGEPLSGLIAAVAFFLIASYFFRHGRSRT